MPDVDDQRAALSAIAAVRSAAMNSTPPLTIFSVEQPISVLITCSRSSSRCAQLEDDLLSLQPSPPSMVALLSPLLHQSVSFILQSSAPVDEEQLECVERLWRLLRNHVRTAQSQSELMADPFVLSSFLSSLAHLSSTFPSSSTSFVSILLITGGQLLANAMTNHPHNQHLFLSHHLLSPTFSQLLSSPLLPFRCSLLYSVHSILTLEDRQFQLLSHPSGLPFLVSLLDRQRLQFESYPQFSPSDFEVSAECDLFVTTVLCRLFSRQAAFMELLIEHLTSPQSVASSRHETLVCDPLTYTLQTLLSLSAEDCGADWLVPVTANCASLVSLVASVYNMPPSVWENATDDSEGYGTLPSTLPVPAWVHAALTLLEHILSTTLNTDEVTLLSTPSPLFSLLSTPPFRFLLLSLLRTPSAFSFHSDLLRLLSLLSSYPTSTPPPFPVLTALTFLSHTHIDTEQPMQREYAIVGIKGLCRWDNVRQELEALKVLEVEGKEEWKRRGVDVEWNEGRGRVTMKQSGSVREDTQPTERRTEKRTSGPIDWGETEPYTDDDFM